MAHLRLDPIRVGLILALLAGTAANAAIIKTVDRKFPLSFCPLPLDGWQVGGSPVNLSFVAPSSSVRVTFSTPNYYNGAFVNTHIDNVSVVLKSVFPDNPVNVHQPSPTGQYYDCYFPPGGDPSSATHAPSFLFTNFSWPGTAGPLLNLFDSSTEGWTGQVYFDDSFSAPRNPATEGDTTGGALGVGLPYHGYPTIASATRIVTGLVPGQEYVVFAWWHAEQTDAPLTLTIDGAACLDPDGDGFVDCSTAPACELQPGQACGDCDETSAAIRPTASDATCDGIDQNCSGQPDEGFPGGCPCTQRATNVVGWWRGEGNAEDWIGSNDGTLTGPGTGFTDGLVGQTFFFSLLQPGGVELPDDDALEFSSQMTLEAWIVPTLLDSTQPIISKTGAFDSAYSLDASLPGILEVTISDGTNFDGLISPNQALDENAWSHVAATFNAGLLKLYVNGALVASKVSSITSIYNQGPLHPNFGRTPSGAQEFVGYIDEPAMYDRALSGDEIRAIYQAGSQGMCACGGLPLATYYRDVDLDGHGNPAVSTTTCAAPAGYVASGDDCDDTDPGVHPGDPDATCNGIDNDCDVQVDEGFPGGCQCTMPASGLLSWFPADGNTTDVRGGLQGSLQNGATYGAGQASEAFSLDGTDDSVDGIGSTSAFAFIQNTGVFTIAAWINLANADGLLQQAVTGNTGTTIEKGHFFLWENSSGQKRLRLGLMNGTDSVPVIDTSVPASTITSGTWHHVAAVGDGTHVTLYVDGAGAVGPGVMGTLGTGNSTRALSLGRCPAGVPSCQFGGRIDEVQIYNRALRASEIQAIHDAGSVQLCRCIDADSDGYGSVGGLTCPAGTLQDCNDTVVSTHPGAPELCNGVDDDCDATLDDGLAQSTFYRDTDGDGYGTSAPTIQACAAPAGYAVGSTDCNDTDAATHPGASDAVCDGIDRNCSGTADEEFVSPPNGWIATPLAGAPGARRLASMVSTGNRVIVWGGLSNFTNTNTGGVFRPRDAATDVWTPTSATNAPSARTYHTAVWTGTDMIIWGGNGGSNTGSLYNPDTDSWAATTLTNAPTAREQHSAVWTGTHMIVWGGSALNTGAAYLPGLFGGTWTALPTTGAPVGRSGHTAVWSGNYMVVWGGFNGGTQYDTGGRYRPTDNTWYTMAASPLVARSRHTAVWTGSKMIVWGGYNGTTYLSDGAIYDPEANSWTAVAPGPPGRYGHTAVWDSTNDLMVIWGGFGAAPLKNDGWAYNPLTNTWTALTTTGAPIGRVDHAAAWLSATREMVVWGGNTGAETNTGGRIVTGPTLCGQGACSAESHYTCTAGQLGYGACTPGTPTTEVCNGIDDDCDGTNDDGIPAPSARPNVLVDKFVTEGIVYWAPVDGATGYDVVRGDLLALRSSGGNFTTSTNGCLANDTVNLYVSDGSLPGPGDGTWILTRAVNACGGDGTYDEGVPSQQGSRDAEIAASPAPCP